MIKNQVSIREGIEDFLCPFADMYVTQGSNGGYSHRGIMANDVRGAQVGVRYAYYAPCDCKLLKVYKDSNTAFWQSLNKVRFANGRIDYATFVTAHDDSFDAKIGQIVRQGQQLGNMGTKGNATGVHCHIEVSQSADMSWTKNQYEIYHFNNEYDLDDCYFVDNTNILNGMGGNWKTTNDEGPTPQLKGKINYRSHVENIGWQGWVKDGQTSGTTGQCSRLEAIQIDSDLEIYAKAHIENKGWIDYGKINKDTVIGTTGEALRLEDICLKGDFKYRVHIENTGWTNWTNADGIATLGTVGQALRIEAIEIK